jgi:hypothetical protein
VRSFQSESYQIQATSLVLPVFFVADFSPKGLIAPQKRIKLKNILSFRLPIQNNFVPLHPYWFCAIRSDDAMKRESGVNPEQTRCCMLRQCL